jgi:hypothetical protein
MQILHLFLFNKIIYLLLKITLEKKVYYLEWDRIILLLHRHLFIKYKEILTKIFITNNKLMKITIKSNNHGDKNMKLNGYQVRINTIFKFHLIVLLT